MAGKKKPAARPVSSDHVPIETLDLMHGDELAYEGGARYKVTANLRGCWWGRRMDAAVYGELEELPPGRVRLVASPNRGRDEDMATVVDPLMAVRR